jgi:hypothetical protein
VRQELDDLRAANGPKKRPEIEGFNWCSGTVFAGLIGDN